MTNKPQETFEQLKDHFQKIACVSSASEVLQWDAQTGLPPEAASYRAEQVTALSGLAHRCATEPHVKQWLDELVDWQPEGDEQTAETIKSCVERLREDYNRQSRLDSRLVEALASAAVRGQDRWVAARKADDYSLFKPCLDEMLLLKMEQGDQLAADGQTTYEALMDEYEPGAKVADLAAVFSELQSKLVDLLGRVRGSKRQVDRTLIEQSFPIDQQKSFSRKLAEGIHFDFDRGRLDTTAHPFCTTLGPHDCRILTRYEENFLPTSIFGTLHEAGHGLYEQGLPAEWFGLPPGTYASLGIHESQSRLWENLVGRSLAFWKRWTPDAKAHFPDQLAHTTPEKLHACFNHVAPSLIRVEADEMTYNIHIIIRFQLEQALMSGDCTSEDLPTVWADAYEENLGVRPPSNADGVLQDVHWSAGLLGYFPTYSLGNLISAQLFDAATKQLGDLDSMFEDGEYRTLLNWLRENIHQHGRSRSPMQLLKDATGQNLAVDPLIKSLESRYAAVYDL